MGLRGPNDSTGKETPRLLTLNEEAKAVWTKFSQYIEANQGEGQELETIQDWTGKLPGAALRIAGLCHVAEYGQYNAVINLATMERALDLCQLLITHAQAAFDSMGSDPTVEDARYIYRWLVDNRKSVLKQNELHRLGRFNKSKIQRLTDALDVLIGRHIISGRHSLSTKKPTYIYHVNPEILEGSHENLA